MNRPHHILPVFLGLSLATHAAVLWYRPDLAALQPAQRPGDAGLQLTLAHPLESTAPAVVNEAPPAAPQPHDVQAAPAPHSSAAPLPGPAPTSPSATMAHHGAEQSAAADSAAGSPLEVQLLDALQPHFHYPLLARRRGWEGTVQVGLHVHADGRISHLHIVASSRHAVLDRAALDCLKRIGQLPGAMAWLDGHDSDIVLPIEYRLTDG